VRIAACVFSLALAVVWGGGCVIVGVNLFGCLVLDWICLGGFGNGDSGKTRCGVGA
jgi:hypothetical protein